MRVSMAGAGVGVAMLVLSLIDYAHGKPGFALAALMWGAYAGFWLGWACLDVKNHRGPK